MRECKDNSATKGKKDLLNRKIINICLLEGLLELQSTKPNTKEKVESAKQHKISVQIQKSVKCNLSM